MAVSGLGVAYVASGFVLLWSGVKNASVKDTLTSFLKGTTPTANPTGAVTVGLSDDSSSGTSSGSSGSDSSVSATGGTVSGAAEKANQATGRALAAGYGWATGSEWTALNNIVMAESGWNNEAQNPTSTAYGIFQFLDSTWATVGYTKTSNPVTQIAAGLKYIKERYGDPVKAWAFHLANGYY